MDLKKYYQSPTYRSWAAMLTRVRNCRRGDWRLYGGRGIRVCSRWQGENGFKYFLEDMGPRPEGKTLDRVNSNGHYEPSNCRWATPLEQIRSRRKGFFRGEKNNQAKLTWEKIRVIRKEWDRSYESIKQLAIKFNVSFGCIAKVVYNESWKGG